jgi:sugar lactone lactonase YvrE
MRLLLTTLAAALAVAGQFGQFGQRPRVLPVGAPPQIASITPSQGPIAGGTDVVVSGAGFTGATVRIDDQPVAPLSQSDTSIRLRMSAHDNGYVVIAVRSAAGDTSYTKYLYVPPRLDEIPPGYITTVAGVGGFKGDFGPALAAYVLPRNLVFDPRGNLYVAESDYDVVSRIRPDGVIERFAGLGTAGITTTCCGDGGPASQASISFPRGVATDGAGNVYIGDDAFRIRRVDAVTGVITTIAGTGVKGFSGDGGPATSALIGQPTYLACTGTTLFFMDFENQRIRRIDASGRITTVAGNGVAGFAGDGGPAIDASLNFTVSSDDGGLAVDSSGNVFVIDVGNARVRRIDGTTGMISTFAQFSTGDHSEAIAADRDGNVYYTNSNRIQKLSPAGAVLKTWGVQPGDLLPDGTPLDQLRFGYVTGMTFDVSGNLVYSDQALHRVRRMNFATNAVETIAGFSPGTIGEEGPAVGAALQLADNGGDIALAQNGDLFVADEIVHRITAATGMIRTVAGRALHIGTQSNLNNVPALTAYLGALVLFVGPNDELDTAGFTSVPYHIDAQGIAHILADFNITCGSSGDGGPALSAKLCQPWDIVRDRNGNIFIADTNNNRIRRIDARTGIITTFAGAGSPISGFENYGHGSFCGDGSPAFSACFNTPYSIAFDGNGNLFVSDSNNGRIRRIDPAGTITTVVQWFGFFASTIRFDRAGHLYANLGDRIIRIDPSGVITTIAGASTNLTGSLRGFSGDGGPALQARLNTIGQSAGLAVSDQGDVFFSDGANRRVRVVRQGSTTVASCTPRIEPAGYLRGTVSGSTVTLVWDFASGATSYVIEAGSSSGKTDLASFDTRNTATTFVASGVAAGAYFVNVRAKGPCGTSSAANEVTVRVP